MCSPAAPTKPFALNLSRLTLDELGILQTHPRANDDVKEAFAAALHVWIGLRLRRLLGRSTQVADRDDLGQEFLVRCYTRYLPSWQPGTCSLSSFLFLRLRCEVVDHLRKHGRVAGRFVDVEDVAVAAEVTASDTSLFAVIDAAADEQRHRLVDDVVARLPRRQRMVLRRSLAGETLNAIAKDVGLSHSTASRERAQAMASVKAALAAASNAVAA